MAVLPQFFFFSSGLGWPHSLPAFPLEQTLLGIRAPRSWGADTGLFRRCALLDSSSLGRLRKSELAFGVDSLRAPAADDEFVSFALFSVDSLDRPKIGSFGFAVCPRFLAAHGVMPKLLCRQWISLGPIGLFPIPLFVDHPDR